MMTQQMPESFVPVLAHLHETPKENFETLYAAVDVLGEPSGIADFAERAGQLAGMSADAAQALLSMLLSTVARAEVGDFDLGELVDDMAASEALGLGDDDQQRLALRVKRLVDHRSTQILHKSLALMREHHSVFLDARIVTDIRPVFGGEVSEGLDAVVLTHSLKVDYVQEGRRSSFHVALDQSDLQVMKSVVERAIDKAGSLRQTLESAGISNLTLEA
ncbi:hypothetical protein [Candidatus Poriferisodalis sp.]|uniref:hypothetical protein n=1 Tax=Candidatus Poriferisodalis sp. TaxID=3101277 RepID=UPI003B5A96C7